MSPSLHSAIVSLKDVPFGDVMDNTGTVPQRSILVVDDEALVADTLSAILRRAGFLAQAAYDGTGALELARVMVPELLISDVAMPVMNGVELALALVAEQPGCKVLLFSGHATSVDLVDALAAGHNFPLLAKPVHPTEMLRWVGGLVGKAAEPEQAVQPWMVETTTIRPRI